MTNNNGNVKDKKGLFLPSTMAFFKEAKIINDFTLFDRIHGYIYARYIYTYIKIGTGRHRINLIITPITAIIQYIQKVLRIFMPRVEKKNSKPTIADTYHGKVMPLAAIKKLVSINEDIRLENLESIIPYRLAKDIILNHPDHLAVMECPCRASREKPCLPMDVCMVVGEPFTSFVLEHHPKKSRSIQLSEALQILQAEDDRGHVHHAFFKDAMLGRYYAICNCCSCCCGAIQAHENGTPMLASSGYQAKIDQELCIGCGNCIEYCQFHALSVENGINFVDFNLCMGCGVCISKCKIEAITLILNPTKGVPLEIDILQIEAAANYA
jgi:Pyruvate/2-oxoacid:ferredoxin oxidoreductase delta subunit